MFQAPDRMGRCCVGCCSLCEDYHILYGGYYRHYVGYCRLYVGCCGLYVDFCGLYVGCCSLYSVCCSHYVGCAVEKKTKIEKDYKNQDSTAVKTFQAEEKKRKKFAWLPKPFKKIKKREKQFARLPRCLCPVFEIVVSTIIVGPFE